MPLLTDEQPKDLIDVRFVCATYCKPHVTHFTLMAMQERRKRSRIEEEKKQLDRRESAAQDEELPKEEVIRRLRLLGQPITLFGEVRQSPVLISCHSAPSTSAYPCQLILLSHHCEDQMKTRLYDLDHNQDDAARAARLKLAQEEFQLEDEHAGGQQANSLLEMQRAAKTQDDKDLAGLDKQKKDAKDAVAAQHNGQEVSRPHKNMQEFLERSFKNSRNKKQHPVRFISATLG